MSLLELVIATSMFAVMMTAVCMVLRTGRQVWEAHEAEFTLVEAAQATLRHVVRRVRQADQVTAISAAADDSGSLSLSLDDGTVVVWDHDANTNCVNFGIGAADSLLATDITALRFRGFRADGVTATTVPQEIRSLRIEVAVPLPAGAGSGVFSSWAWLRSW